VIRLIAAAVRDGFFTAILCVVILGGIIALYVQAQAHFAMHAPELRVESVTVPDGGVSGGSLQWTRTICNRTQHDIDAVYSPHFLTADDQREITAQGSFTLVVRPGCNAYPGTVTLPPGVGPGEWKLRSIVEWTPRGGLIQITSGTSEPFEVTGG